MYTHTYFTIWYVVLIVMDMHRVFGEDPLPFGQTLKP